MTRRGRPDRGSATVWVLATCVLLLLVGSLAAVRAAAVLARHRAEVAADLAALAGAGALGTAAAPCAAARSVAGRNSAALVSCRVRADPSGRKGVVDVVVALTVRLPGVGSTRVRASARAGRAGEDASSVAAAGQFGATGLGVSSVWHAGPSAHNEAFRLRTDAGDGEQKGERVEVSVSQVAAEDVPVVSVNGEVDVYSAPELKESLAKLRQSGAHSVVVDLTEVAFLDSTGLGALVEARAAATEAGGSLSIVCNQERILKLFTITGLDGVFSIHKSLDTALADLQH